MYEADGYLGFTFAGRHSSEFGILVVSDGSRYHQNFSGSFNDTITNVPGYNGGYYFGTQITMRDFEIKCAFDNMTTHMRDKIQSWLYPNKVGWLIYDEAPYKKYLVKISQPISFSYLPFNNKNKNYFFEQDILKGEFSIPFFSFKEYAIGNEEYKRPSFINEEDITQQDVDSGIIPEGYNIGNIILSNQCKTINGGIFYLYNAGNGIAFADFYFNIKKSELKKGLYFLNYEDGQSYIVKDFSNEENLKSLDNETWYRIEILSTKKEIWAYKIYNNEIIPESKTNIGKYYNQYYPKIYHSKPTEVLMVTQTIDSQGNSEPIFYPIIYNSNNFLPSDSKNNIYYFEEFKSRWSDYLLCSTRSINEVNDILNPATLFIDLKGDNYRLSEDSLIYLIYPNKFKVSVNINYFTPIYDNTYI